MEQRYILDVTVDNPRNGGTTRVYELLDCDRATADELAVDWSRYGYWVSLYRADDGELVAEMKPFTRVWVRA